MTIVYDSPRSREQANVLSDDSRKTMRERRTPFGPCDAPWVLRWLTAMQFVRVCAYFRATKSFTPLDTDAGATQSGV